MEDKQARLTVLIDPKNKAAFEAACSARDVSASAMLRQLIVDYLARHGKRCPGAGDGSSTPAE